MTHKQAKNQDQKRSVGLKDRVKTDGRMDMTDCSIFSANAVGNVITFNNVHNIIIDLRNVCKMAITFQHIKVPISNQSQQSDACRSIRDNKGRYTNDRISS